MLRGLDALGSIGLTIFEAKIAFCHRHAGGQPNQRANARTNQCILARIAAPECRGTRSTHRSTRQGTRRRGLIPALRLLAHGLLLSRERLAACGDIRGFAGRQQQRQR